MRDWKRKTEGEKVETPGATVSDIVDTISSESTEPTVAAEPEAPKASAPSDGMPSIPSSDGTRDAAGETFDPTRHSVGADGKPVFTAKGVFRRRRGSGSLRVAPSAVQTASDEQKYMLAGKTCAEVLFQGASLIGGSEWQPRLDPANKVDERADMSAAFATYCKAKGLSDIPPGVVLVAIIAAYAAPRFTQPVTKQRTRGAVMWLREKYIKWRARRASQPADRNDGERQNDASEKDSGGAAPARS
jgi:hypothetical protein